MKEGGNVCRPRSVKIGGCLGGTVLFEYGSHYRKRLGQGQMTKSLLIQAQEFVLSLEDHGGSCSEHGNSIKFEF